MKTWAELFELENTRAYFQAMRAVIAREKQQYRIWPQATHIFRAFRLCPLAEVNVVVLGQDPYHGFNQANGLAFSVQRHQPLPPSLQNIFKELCADLHIAMPVHGDLTTWAQQGVLLLNTALTVREGAPNSHRDIGWYHFTEAVLRLLNEQPRPIMFVLWGAAAQRLALPLIRQPFHSVILSAHPSPLAAAKGFFGSAPFSQINRFLDHHHRSPIHWAIHHDV